LYQNFPNPFNPTTDIRFSVHRAMHLTLEVFDIAGRSVGTLLDGVVGAGEHTVRFHADRLATGFYVCRLRGEGHSEVRKMVVIH
jgi:hypothetical protein